MASTKPMLKAHFTESYVGAVDQSIDQVNDCSNPRPPLELTSKGKVRVLR